MIKSHHKDLEIFPLKPEKQIAWGFICEKQAKLFLFFTDLASGELNDALFYHFSLLDFRPTYFGIVIAFLEKRLFGSCILIDFVCYC